MATPVTEVVKINWKQIFPWLALFRALGMSLHVRQVMVGVIAVSLIAAGQTWLLESPFPRPSILYSQDLGGDFSESVWVPVADQVYPLIMPYLIVDPGATAPSPPTAWQLTKLLLTIAWGLIIGSLAGGVLARRSAFEFAREESLSLKEAVLYVKRRSFDYLSAPALPLCAALALGLVLILAGSIARWLPGGGYLVSATWSLLYLCGLTMAVLLLTVLAAWPMMVAAVSVNGGDGFDALSRGFGFVMDRWRYYAWCLCIMTAYGGLCALMLGLAKQYGETLILASLSRGWGPSAITDLPRLLPAGAWENCLSLIGSGLAYSFFWSSMTIIYVVLRKSVDNADLQELYLDGGPENADDLQALINPQIPPAPRADDAHSPPGPTLLPIIEPPLRS